MFSWMKSKHMQQAGAVVQVLRWLIESIIN